MERVYVETSVVSLLVARDSRAPVTFGMQVATRNWWNSARSRFECVVSELVIQEAACGDHDSARSRLGLMAGLLVLKADASARALAKELLRTNAVPRVAAEDAAHIAIATVNASQYLATWNCRHINNPYRKRLIEGVCYASGFVCPVICTPSELLEKHNGNE